MTGDKKSVYFRQGTGSLIELRGISKKYGPIAVVKKVSFKITPGQVLGYLGPNGAGKTTTIKVLAGLLEPTEGEILCDGVNIKKDMIAYKKRLGYVPEQSEIYPHLSAYEYLLLVGRLRHLHEKSLKEKIERFLELFGLADDMHAAISSYSKGMRQKVLISAALLHNPDILLLDEPLSGLDVTTTLTARDLIRRLALENKTVLFSSHILEVTEKICSRVVILHRGVVAADDSVENLRVLMKVPSLERIFSQLAVEVDTEAVACSLVEVMKQTS